MIRGDSQTVYRDFFINSFIKPSSAPFGEGNLSDKSIKRTAFVAIDSGTIGAGLVFGAVLLLAAKGAIARLCRLSQPPCHSLIGKSFKILLGLGDFRVGEEGTTGHLVALRMRSLSS